MTSGVSHDQNEDRASGTEGRGLKEGELGGGK